MAQTGQQFLVVQGAGPGAHGLTVAIEHADDGISHVANRAQVGIDGRPVNLSSGRDVDAGIVGRIARPPLRLWHLQR